MPMLDENEYAEVSRLYDEAMKSTKEFRRHWGVPLEKVPIDELFSPLEHITSA